MSKVDEARAVVYLRTVYPGDYTVIDKLIQAVRDEEWGRAVASGYVEDTACPRCSIEACSVCPADKTRYCA